MLKRLKLLKLHQFSVVRPELFSIYKYGCRKRGTNLKNSVKKAVFLVSSGKNRISPFWPPPKKNFWKSPLVALFGKNLSGSHAYKHVKLHHFCKKLFCVIPYGNNVEQHQCGNRAIAGWPTVHGVFCQTNTKSCQIHCQITDNRLQIILTKYCPKFAHVFH